ncbi:MAG: AAA family ATPase [Thaumarchaeota archaeon]|nr:AAA family ATPase [Nitrososphaerota archaeon]
MKLNKVDVEGFRGLVKEQFQLDDMTVFHGEMGTGKTSRLLAILYGLTGLAPSGVNLDEMINVDSDHMWVKIEGNSNSKPFTLERSKRLDRPSSSKTDLQDAPKIGEEIFIEGREISRLFLGAPTEKTFRIDALLGLSKYNQIASEISTAQIEKRIEELKRIQKDVAQASTVKEKLSKAESDLVRLTEERSKVREELDRDADRYQRAEDNKRRIEEQEKRNSEVRSKQTLIKSYEEQLIVLPQPSPELEENFGELEKRYEALQRRATYIEAVMQTLDIDGKRINEIATCPVCGALISSNALQKFQHHDEEYRHIIGEVTQLEVDIGSKRQALEESKRSRGKREMLQAELQRLKTDLNRISTGSPVQPGELKEAEDVLKRQEELSRKARELDIRVRSLEEQVEAYRALFNQIGRMTVAEVDAKIQKLTKLKESLQKIKVTLVETLSEARSSQLDNLRSSFKTTFRRIYPYQRLKDIDIETVSVRGRDTIQVKGLAGGRWIRSNQMSTGENVAVSFALLFAANQLEAAPILLLDEPEEGLDENGVQGLADILNTLKTTTQMIVATRNTQLTRLLSPEPEETAVA